MPDIDIGQRHAQAILALLGASPPLGTPLVVYDGAVPAPPLVPATEYVLVYLVTATPGITGLAGTSDRTVTRAYCHCVGRDAIAARAIAGRVRSGLLNQVPAISGASCAPIRDDGIASAPQRDQKTGVLVMDQLAVYRLESVPA